MRLPSAWRRRTKAGQSGQSLVELSLVLPVFLLLLAGLVEVGDALNSYLTVVDAARDGARLGSRGQASDATIRYIVVKDMERLRDDISPASDITIAYDTMPGDDSIKVEVCIDHTLIFPVPGFIPDPIRMCSSTTMRSIVYE